MPAKSQLHLQLLGPFEVWRGGVPIPPAEWRGQKPRDLLKVLVLARGQYVSTDQLAEWLWPGAAPSAAEASLRSAVSDLRRLLEPDLTHGRASAFIHTRREGYRFNLDAPVTVDWLLLEQALATRARAGIEAALARWPGELLPEDPYAEWAQPARDRLRALRLDAWAIVADSALEAGEYAAAVTAAENGLALDDAREALWRTLMRAHHLGGDRAAALRAFDRCRTALSRELGTDPLPETLAVHQHILQAEAEPIAVTPPTATAAPTSTVAVPTAAVSPPTAVAPPPPAAEPRWLFRLASLGLVLWVLATGAQLAGMLAGLLRGSLVSSGDLGAEALPALLANPAALAELHQQRYLLIPLGLLLLPAYAAWFAALRAAARPNAPGGLAWLGLGLGGLDVLAQTLSRALTVAQVTVLPEAFRAAADSQRATLITLWDLLRQMASIFGSLSALAHPLAVGLLSLATLIAARQSPPPLRWPLPLGAAGLALSTLTLLYTFVIPGAALGALGVPLGLGLAAATYAWLLALAAAIWR
jgi:DNA-binding SARP family transcriptional activator